MSTEPNATTPADPELPEGVDLEDQIEVQHNDQTDHQSTGHATAPGLDHPAEHSTNPIRRFGLTPVLAAAATAITAVVAAVNLFSGHDPQPAPRTSADAGISDYWSGIPQGTTQPLIFHLLVSEPVEKAKTATPSPVSGTMRSPCQGEGAARIDRGSWDGRHLTVEVTDTGSGKPLSLTAELKPGTQKPAAPSPDAQKVDELAGEITQSSYHGSVTLTRGEAPCPKH